MGSHACRSCAGHSGRMVLDLGNQPACDHFPASDDRDSDPTYPLQMWLCSTCGLARLLGEPIVAEEPLGTEPEAPRRAVRRRRRAAGGDRLALRSKDGEFPSPHGGSWLGLLNDRGLETVAVGGPGDLVIDSFGMMHEPDQASALAERIARVAPGGVLLLQYHSLDTIIRLGQSNAPPARALCVLLDQCAGGPCWRPTASSQGRRGRSSSMAARSCWPPAESDGGREEDDSVTALLSDDSAQGVRDAAAVASLQSQAEAHAEVSTTGSSRGRTTEDPSWDTAPPRVPVALYCAGVDRRLLPAVVDTSTAKHGLRMPGTDIPIVGPAALTATGPHDVLLFVPDLLNEVRRIPPGGSSRREMGGCGGPARLKGRAGATPLRRCRPRRLPRDGSLHVGQDLSQVIETASPRRPDAPDRHPQLLGDLLVGKVVVTHQQAEETLAARRQLLCRLSNRTLLLASEEACVERVTLLVHHEVHEVVG